MVFMPHPGMTVPIPPQPAPASDGEQHSSPARVVTPPTRPAPEPTRTAVPCPGPPLD